MFLSLSGKIVKNSSRHLAEYNLTTCFEHFLDLHLVLPLLVFPSMKEKEFLQEKLDFLGDFHIVDFAMVLYQNLCSDTISYTLREKRATVVEQLKQLQAETEPIV